MGYGFKNNIDKGYFLIQKLSISNLTIQYYLDKYKIDLDDYWIVKSTRNFKLIDKSEINNYAGITCIDKNLYSKEYIERFFEFLIKIDLTIPYLNKPMPPIKILNKIKVVQWDIN